MLLYRSHTILCSYVHYRLHPTLEIMSTTLITEETPAPCSAEVALGLYRSLEYYRNFMPFILDISEAKYASLAEAKGVDARLEAYIKETGVVPERKPT